MKLSFLLAQESKNEIGDTFYEFLPYRYGPFSFTLYHELDSLIRDGFVEVASENEIALSYTKDNSSSILDRDIELRVRAIIRLYGKLSTAELLDFVYDRYKWFTLKSEFPERRAVKDPMYKPAIYTSGYEGMQVDGFFNLLLKWGIKRFIDVRANPVSRRYGFHKKTLSSICEKLGIEYLHYPTVGIPSTWRTDLKGFVSYQRLFERYVNEILPANVEIIHELAKKIEEIPSVLVCQEEDKLFCHRTKLANAVAEVSKLKPYDLRT